MNLFNNVVTLDNRNNPFNVQNNGCS